MKSFAVFALAAVCLLGNTSAQYGAPPKPPTPAPGYGAAPKPPTPPTTGYGAAPSGNANAGDKKPEPAHYAGGYVAKPIPNYSGASTGGGGDKTPKPHVTYDDIIKKYRAASKEEQEKTIKRAFYTIKHCKAARAKALTYKALLEGSKDDTVKRADVLKALDGLLKKRPRSKQPEKKPLPLPQPGYKGPPKTGGY